MRSRSALWRRLCAPCGGVALAVLAVAAGGAGCSGGSDPAPALTTHQVGTAPSSTAPSATATTTSAAERKAAAIAAVQRLYAEYNAMLKSGSSKAYRQTFTSTCTLCVSDALIVERLTRNQEHVTGGEYRVSSLKVVYTGGRFLIVEGDLAQEKATITRAGQTLKRYPYAPASRVSWHVEPMSDSWHITQSQVLQ